MKNKKTVIPILLGVVSIVSPYFGVLSNLFIFAGIVSGITGFVYGKRLSNGGRSLIVAKVLCTIGIIVSILMFLYFNVSN
ncbi:hypothetical protein GCM10010965_28970 [Caldalkalibacillus thermarum]|uniref:hypothetical protein n=1 Tax=Caldalkalibacillus thermarum TaxID=296745 RepID=UPI00166CCF50|nr:hypothetical protein [Caldalkalibacillus thermarum]GGK34232.1 hypothetical protein GCM10010965_28970 [Caldalkalibacillus thermarum]